MKKFLAGFCAAAIAAGCMGMTVMADTEATDKLTSYEATSDNVKLIGRTYRKGDTTILGYSASGIEFKCTGTKAVFNVNGSVGEARIGVFVNGKLVKQGYIKNKKTNAVEVDLPEGESTVKLIKLSEAAQSVIAIDSFEVDGKPQQSILSSLLVTLSLVDTALTIRLESHFLSTTRTPQRHMLTRQHRILALTTALYQ